MKQWEMAKLYPNDERVLPLEMFGTRTNYRGFCGVDFVHAAATIVPTAEYNPMNVLKRILKALERNRLCVRSESKEGSCLSTDKARAPQL